MIQVKHTITGSEPITLAETKLALKVDYITDDTFITSLITSARRQAEQFCGRSLIAQTLEYYNDEQADRYVLPYPEHDSITEVKIDGVATTDFSTLGINQFVVKFSYDLTFEDNIYVKYLSLGTLPDGMKPILLKIITDMYENRNDQNLSQTAMAQLLAYKKY